MKTSINIILNKVKEHTYYRRECLNLIASENLMSPLTLKILASDLGNRYTIGQPKNRSYAGCRYYDRIEETAIALAKKLFHAQYVNLQSTSGMIANMTAYYTLLKPNDLLLSLEVKNGGHYSHTKIGMLSLFNIRVEPLPFNENDYTLDLEKAVMVIRKKRPSVILLGTSEFLFPLPVRELRKVCDEVGAKILYDAAHVAGLIAGQTFQNPLAEGADLLSMSTNKTLAAPDHGIIACNRPDLYQKRIEYAIMPMFTSNHHPHHLAGLAVTLSEFDRFGQQYATQVIKNAQVLARELYQQGVAVLCPHKNFTQSHTVLFDAKFSGEKTRQILEKVNIITNQFQLPWNNEDDPSGIRLGTGEVTRLGMKEKEMKIIAGFIASALFKRENLKKIKKDVIDFRRQYQTINYCFNHLKVLPKF